VGEPTHKIGWSGGKKMNGYKIKAIVDWIRGNGGLPTDQFGNTLPPDDLLVWYGLNDLLSAEEQRVMKREPEALVESQIVIDQLKANMP
jgi:hypothetical protein